MLIVSCQLCGECRVLPEAPDGDGFARACWICPRCGAGQVVQLEVTADARGNVERIVLGMRTESGPLSGDEEDMQG